MNAQSAADILAHLSVEEIEFRLEELDRETRALRVLLRAARLRRRTNTQPQLPSEAPDDQ